MSRDRLPESNRPPTGAGLEERTRDERIIVTENRILELISSGAPLATVLEAITLGIESIMPSTLASVLLLDDDGVHLRRGTAPSLPEVYNRAIEGAPIGPMVGSCGTAMYRREAVIVTDIATDPLWADYRDLALAHGLRACWSTPVIDSTDRVVASLALYYRAPGAPDRDDFELIARIAHLVGIAVENQRRIAALRASEERFRQLAEAIDEVFWMSDSTTRRGLYISPAYERIWGRPCEDLHEDGEQWFETIHPADRERVRNALKDESSGDYNIEYRIVRPDGAVRWILDRAFPVRGESGAVYRIVGVARDITELKQSQLALRERIKELRCLYRVLELTTNDMQSVAAIGVDIARLLPASLLHEHQALARLVIDDAQYAEYWRTPVASLRASIQLDGQSCGFVEIGYLTEQADQGQGHGPFLAEEKALIDGVATHVGRMLYNRRMADSLRQSQRLEAVGQLTGGLAHDFNNLLTVIRGNADLLGEELADQSRLRPLAEMIAAAAQRGAELTQQLLAFARKQALAPEAVAVNRLISDMDAMLHRTLGEHIEIKLFLSDVLWPALVDPTQLESALLNLALNARDAMPGGGKLTIETANAQIGQHYAERHPDVQPGHYVLVAVSDTGNGIDAGHLERVFEPFYTTKEKGKGTGLGLSMVYGFVKQSQGHVKVYSEPGQGTTVKLYLPRATEAAAPAPESAGPRDAVTGGEETVLLVEDDELVRRYAEGQLRRLGYRVMSAANGPEALEMLRRHADAIDLLFTDIIMPGGMSGRDLAEAARDLRPDLKVLYTSGYTENAIVHHGRLDSGVQLLGKPYRRGELARKIREVLDGG